MKNWRWAGRALAPRRPTGCGLRASNANPVSLTAHSTMLPTVFGGSTNDTTPLWIQRRSVARWSCSSPGQGWELPCVRSGGGGGGGGGPARRPALPACESLGRLGAAGGGDRRRRGRARRQSCRTRTICAAGHRASSPYVTCSTRIQRAGSRLVLVSMDSVSPNALAAVMRQINGNAPSQAGQELLPAASITRRAAETIFGRALESFASARPDSRSTGTVELRDGPRTLGRPQCHRRAAGLRSGARGGICARRRAHKRSRRHTRRDSIMIPSARTTR